MKRFIIPLTLLIVLVATFLPQSITNVQASTIPTFSIVSVVEDSKVTIKTLNFPKDTDFKVTMGKYGTKGIGGILVTTTDSEGGGILTLTYDIPADLKGLDRIAIRLEATSGGYYAYNWFWNNPSEGSSETTPGYTGIPTFSIVSVVEDDKVSIKTSNFPKNVDFKVLMGKYGTKGIGGTLVTTTNSGEGGVLSLEYNIPDGLKGLDRIAIRLEATSGGYYAFNWFWNNDSTGATPTTPTTPVVPGYTGIPTFLITAVKEDSSVTIKTTNLPKGVEFKVLMGKYGTKAIGGTLVATTDSGDGGTLTLTYDVPESLKGLDRIAIRMEATSGGYYAYNWFWNNTYP
jgi:hypothetical protein